MFEEFNAITRELLPEDWELHPLGDLLICPHEAVIEMDGQCPEGCISPLREQGLI